MKINRRRSGIRNAFFCSCFSFEKIWNFNILTTPCANAWSVLYRVFWNGTVDVSTVSQRLWRFNCKALPSFSFFLFFFLARTRTKTVRLIFFFFFNYIIASSLSVKIYSTKFSRKFFSFKRNVIFHPKKRLQTIFISILPIHYWQIYLKREWHEIGVMDCSSR